MSKIFATLPSTAEVASDADVVNHWMANKPVKLYNGNWCRREQQGIFKLMGVQELIIIWQLKDFTVMNTTIMVN